MWYLASLEAWCEGGDAAHHCTIAGAHNDATSRSWEKGEKGAGLRNHKPFLKEMKEDKNEKKHVQK